MRRGEVRMVDLELAVGSEANERRPAVIVSRDQANLAATRSQQGVVTVLPLTSNTTKVYPFQVLLRRAETGLPQDAKAQAEQIRAVSVNRLGPALAALSADVMEEVDHALRLHLQF